MKRLPHTRFPLSPFAPTVLHYLTLQKNITTDTLLRTQLDVELLFDVINTRHRRAWHLVLSE